MKLKSFISILLIGMLLVSCNPFWRSYDGKTEKELLEIGYKTGYEWGLEFGYYMYQDNGWEKLKESAKNEYFGEIVTSEDNKVFQKFSKELFRGMQEGIRANRAKAGNSY